MARLRAPADMTSLAIRRGAARIRRLARAQSGVAAIEFAVTLPILLTLGMFGTEIAYLATVNTEISQLALSVADNASRLGQTDNSSVTPTVTESDINSVMTGAMRQGAGISFQTKGRVILTSLEKDAFTAKQWIHWQRCRGNLTSVTSSYGSAATGANGLTGPVITGMGASGHQITASTGSAVMFVEVSYRYTGLFDDLFLPNRTIKQEAAFIIRDDRNLTPGVTGTGGASAC